MCLPILQMAKLPPSQLFYLAFEILVTIISLLGNALVAFVFLRDRRMRTSTNLYIFSLAIVNLLTGIIAVPISLDSVLSGRPYDFLGCLGVHTMIVTFCTISIFHLIAVSFDRFLAVVLNVRLGMKCAVALVFVAWCVGGLIGCAPLFGWNKGTVGLDLQNFKCEFLKVMSYSYLLFIFFSTIVVSSLMMIIFYILIFKAVRRHAGRNLLSVKVKNRKAIQMQDVGDNEEGGKKETDDQLKAIADKKKVIKSLLLVIIFFFICWYPLHIMNVITYFKGTIFLAEHFYAPIVLSHASNAINPFIYGLTMPRYSEAFVEALACQHPAEEYERAKRRKARRSQLSKRVYERYQGPRD